jgi:hypothetical protein
MNQHTEKLEQAKAELLDFQSRHPRSREDVAEAADEWLAGAQKVSAFDLATVLGGGGVLDRDHLRAVVDAFVISSSQFAAWVAEEVDARGLMSRKKQFAELAKLERAVSDAERDIVRAQLEAEKAAVESRLAELELKRAEPEALALDYGSLKMRDDIASARAGVEREVQAPRLPWLLYGVEPVEPPLRLSHLLGERMRAAAVGTAARLRELCAAPRVAAPLAQERL